MARNPAQGAPKKPATGATRAGPSPPRRFKRGRKQTPVRERFITSFKAEGSIGKSLAEHIYGGLVVREGPRYNRKALRYAELQSNSPPGFPDSPGIWVSNEGFVLGQVNFPGQVKLSTLFLLLNKALNLIKPRGGVADFRDVYRTWKWKWQIVRVPFVSQSRQAEFRQTREGKPVVVASKSGRSSNR